MTDLRAWARQPTTVAGFSGVIATVSAMMLGELGWMQAVPVLVGAVTSMLLPDNAGAKQEAQALAQDVVASIRHK